MSKGPSCGCRTGWTILGTYENRTGGRRRGASMTDQAAGGSASVLELFSQATAIRARAAGVFDADVSAEWTIAGIPNGGYLLALLGRAASSLTESGCVVAASAHYLRP